MDQWNTLGCTSVLWALLGLGLAWSGRSDPGATKSKQQQTRWFPAIRSIGGHPPSQREPGRELRQATRSHAHEVNRPWPCAPTPYPSLALILSGTSRSPRSENEKGSESQQDHQRQDIALLLSASSHLTQQQRTTQTTLTNPSTHPEHVVPLPYHPFPLVRAQNLPMDLDVQFSRVPTPALSAVESTLDPVA
jgi:hypothetical protein